MKLKSTRSQHYCEISCEPAAIAGMGITRSLWYETEDEIRMAFAAAAEKALLLQWVRREMKRRLTPRERRFLELHYFHAMNMEDVAARIGVHRTTVSRALGRAVEKLRRAAREVNGEENARRNAIRLMRNRPEPEGLRKRR